MNKYDWWAMKYNQLLSSNSPDFCMFCECKDHHESDMHDEKIEFAKQIGGMSAEMKKYEMSIKELKKILNSKTKSKKLSVTFRGVINERKNKKSV